jgi:N-formylglutamate deformylase
MPKAYWISCEPEHEILQCLAIGRFKGGYITRHFAAPAQGMHAVQLEIAMRSYMKESAPFALDETRAAALRPLLRQMMQAAVDWAA